MSAKFRLTKDDLEAHLNSSHDLIRIISPRYLEVTFPQPVRLLRIGERIQKGFDKWINNNLEIADETDGYLIVDGHYPACRYQEELLQ